MFVEQLALDNQHFAVAELAQMIEIAGQLDERAAPLSLRERFLYAQAPVDTRTDQLMQQFLGWTERHAWDGAAGAPDFLHDVDEHSRLDRMEQALRACTLWQARGRPGGAPRGAGRGAPGARPGRRG